MKNLEKTIIYSGKWLQMNVTKFTTSNGGPGIWEHVSRPTRVADSDGVSILATIKHENCMKLVTVAVYRIPLNQWVLELPAGMIDAKDLDPVTSALRELKEETGYTAFRENVEDVGLIAYNDPWKSNECSRLIKVRIDGELNENKKPIQDLDPEEHINVELIPLDNMNQHLGVLMKEKNYAIDSRIYLFSLGLAFTTK
jgi:8-oxo-dGTP pyrophosphatase MutT (NUDIX family)